MHLRVHCGNPAPVATPPGPPSPAAVARQKRDDSLARVLIGLAVLVGVALAVVVLVQRALKEPAATPPSPSGPDELLWLQQVTNNCSEYESAPNEIIASEIYRRRNHTLIADRPVQLGVGTLSQIDTSHGGGEAEFVITSHNASFHSTDVELGSPIYRAASQLREGSCVVFSGIVVREASAFERSKVCDSDYMIELSLMVPCPPSRAAAVRTEPTAETVPTTAPAGQPSEPVERVGSTGKQEVNGRLIQPRATLMFEGFGNVLVESFEWDTVSGPTVDVLIRDSETTEDGRLKVAGRWPGTPRRGHVLMSFRSGATIDTIHVAPRAYGSLRTTASLE